MALFNQHISIIGPTLAQLKFLLCGGEQGKIESFTALLRHGGPIHLINGYGPTESTTFATPAPLGAVGELYICGDGVALGYLNLPELTAARFLPNPFSMQSEARTYKTGDMIVVFVGSFRQLLPVAPKSSPSQVEAFYHKYLPLWIGDQVIALKLKVNMRVGECTEHTLNSDFIHVLNEFIFTLGCQSNLPPTQAQFLHAIYLGIEKSVLFPPLMGRVI
ncbi:hypothetical protein EC968_005842 [Mortierella alpina]|nr:hypothetical protein EC968_005842 [Mortierella alpina]